MKHSHKMKVASILTAFVMVVMQLFATNLCPVKASAATQKTVLWSGNESVSGDWSNWTCAARVNITDQSIFNQKFDLQVKFSGSTAPVLVFMSWSGGKDWVQLNAFYSSDGIAYYPYDSIKGALGDDLNKVNALLIYPNGADLTVTELAMCEATSFDDVSVQYEGLAGTLAKQMGAGWNLGNTLDSTGDWIAESTDGSVNAYETAWGNVTTTEEMIKAVKAAGFDSIRVPVTWHNHMDDANGYKVDDAWMDRVEEIVHYVLDNGMTCILNVHHDTGTDGWLRATDSSFNNYNKKFEALWTQIAERFEGYSNKLLFEGFNEMLDDNNNWSYPGKKATAVVNKWNQLFVDTVRATGGNNKNRCLIVNTYVANSENATLDDFVLPTDTAKNSMMVEVHYYNPYFFCANISNDTKETEWRKNGGETLVGGTMYSLYKHFTSKGIPVIVGEIGAANKDNTENRADYAAYAMKEASKYGIRCFWWDEGNNHDVDPQWGFYTGFSLFHRATLTWDYEEVKDAFVNNCSDNIKLVNGVELDTPASKEPVVSETPATSDVPVVSETPVVSEEPIVSETPVVSEEPVVSEAPEQPVGDNVPVVTVASNIGSTVSMNYTIKANKGSIDLSKVKLVFSYTKDGNAAESFWCDNAGISYNTAPYYENYAANVSGKFTADGLTIDLTGKTVIGEGSSITIQTRMNQSDWSSYQNFTAEKVTVYYDGVVCQTILF